MYLSLDFNLFSLSHSQWSLFSLAEWEAGKAMYVQTHSSFAFSAVLNDFKSWCSFFFVLCLLLKKSINNKLFDISLLINEDFISLPLLGTTFYHKPRKSEHFFSLSLFSSRLYLTLYLDLFSKGKRHFSWNSNWKEDFFFENFSSPTFWYFHI